MRRKRQPAIASSAKHATSSNSSGRNASLTVSDAYQGNLLLYGFLAKYMQKVLLERNITRVLAVQADLLKAEKHGRRRNLGAKRLWSGGVARVGFESERGSGSGNGEEKRTLDEVVERLAFVPEFEDGLAFGVMPMKLCQIKEDSEAGADDQAQEHCQTQEGNKSELSNTKPKNLRELSCRCEITLFALKRQADALPHSHDGFERIHMFDQGDVPVLMVSNPESLSEYHLKLERPFEVPFSAFAIDKGSEKPRLADGYEIQFTIKPQSQLEAGWQHILGNGIPKSGALVVSFKLNTLLQRIAGQDSIDGLPIRHQQTGEIHPKIQIILKSAWNGRINFTRPQSQNCTKRRSPEESRTTTQPDPKRLKTAQIDYSFRGSVKHFDEQDQKHNSKLNTNNKIYSFRCQGPGYTCVICGNTTFQSLERLRFHLKNTHLYLAFALAEHKSSTVKDLARITVDPAVESASSKPSLHHSNQRTFMWVRPRGYKAFNAKEYLEGDNSWTKSVGMSEMERKLMNGPGRACRRKGIVPELRSDRGERRKCVVPEHENGEKFVRFQTKEVVNAGDEVSESEDEVEEGWLEDMTADVSGRLLKDVNFVNVMR
ncbi:hypothetical protein ABW20_dc0108508 [Dactylellina cionopaga]|nr:hypothetical protein ABW20_dc0108508 [Dactylellina cionopaga]